RGVGFRSVRTWRRAWGCSASPFTNGFEDDRGAWRSVRLYCWIAMSSTVSISPKEMSVTVLPGVMGKNEEYSWVSPGSMIRALRSLPDVDVHRHVGRLPSPSGASTRSGYAVPLLFSRFTSCAEWERNAIHPFPMSSPTMRLSSLGLLTR